MIHPVTESVRKGATHSGVSESRAFSEQKKSQVISKFDFGFNNLNAQFVGRLYKSTIDVLFIHKTYCYRLRPCE